MGDIVFVPNDLAITYTPSALMGFYLSITNRKVCIKVYYSTRNIFFKIGSLKVTEWLERELDSIFFCALIEELLGVELVSDRLLGKKFKHDFIFSVA